MHIRPECIKQKVCESVHHYSDYSNCTFKFRSLIELVHKHQTETGYDLDKIQEDIVSHFIAGKLPIDNCQTKLKMQFHYKLIHTEQSKMEHPTE